MHSRKNLQKQISFICAKVPRNEPVPQNSKKKPLSHNPTSGRRDRSYCKKQKWAKIMHTDGRITNNVNTRDPIGSKIKTMQNCSITWIYQSWESSSMIEMKNLDSSGGWAENHMVPMQRVGKSVLYTRDILFILIPQ